jgi:hypothetical protein
MTTKPPENQPQNPQKKRKPGCLLLIIILLILFLWKCEDSKKVVWVGSFKPGFPSASVISGNNPFTGPSTTIYNSEYLRWAGEVPAGQFVTFGRISIQRTEIPVGVDLDPLAPAVVYGTVVEANNVGIKLMVFDEENYFRWREGSTGTNALLIKEGITNQDYLLDISTRAYYIVLDNREGASDAFVGFTGLMAHVRKVQGNELSNAQEQYPTATWEIQKRKVNIFRYILDMFDPSQNVPVTPPSFN